MKTLIFSTVIALMMSFSVAAASDGNKVSSVNSVQIFQVNTESVDVYVAKNAGELIRIKIYSESGTQLMSTRVKKQNARYIRYHLGELPKGVYRVCVEQDKEILSSLIVSN